jgi:hypothetical protein
LIRDKDLAVFAERDAARLVELPVAVAELPPL